MNSTAQPVLEAAYAFLLPAWNYLNGPPTVLAGIVAGMIAALIAVWTYTRNRSWEERDARRGTASILIDETRRMRKFSDFAEGVWVGQRQPEFPTDHIYRGLLQTGNIMRFDRDLRESLDRLYSSFGNSTLSLDEDLYDLIARRLERIESINVSGLSHALWFIRIGRGGKPLRRRT